MTSSEQYSIKEMIAELRVDIKSQFDEVKEKQDHTNGTVRDHTIQLAMMKGGLVVISLIVIPLLVYVWHQNVENSKQLHAITTVK